MNLPSPVFCSNAFLSEKFAPTSTECRQPPPTTSTRRESTPDAGTGEQSEKESERESSKERQRERGRWKSGLWSCQQSPQMEGWGTGDVSISHLERKKKGGRTPIDLVQGTKDTGRPQRKDGTRRVEGKRAGFQQGTFCITRSHKRDDMCLSMLESGGGKAFQTMLECEMGRNVYPFRGGKLVHWG